MNTDPMIQLPSLGPSSSPVPVQASVKRLSVQAFGQTDRGRVRSENQDQFLVATLATAFHVDQSSVGTKDTILAEDRGHLFLVADGMGGVIGGAHASALAVDAIEEALLPDLRWLCAPRSLDGAKVLEGLRTALSRADARLFEETKVHPELEGMGTTATLAYVHNHELFLAHAGDSRCYLLRDARLNRLTKDHTLVRELMDKGLIEPAMAKRHAFRHIVTNIVGGDSPGLRVDAHMVELLPGDTLLLCSDGLTEMVPDEGIGTILLNSKSPRAACERLLTRANELGGVDNITAIVATFTDRDGGSTD